MSTKFNSAIPFAFFAISYGIVVFFKGWGVGAYTLAVGITAIILAELLGSVSWQRKALAYIIFFITPLLTAMGQIGALTGFGRSDISLPWQGIAFATSGIAFQIYQGKLRASQLFGSILQPLRLISGPFATSFEPLKKINLPRFRIYAGWVILGSFFYGVLASGIAPLLVLRQSTESLDVFVFAVIFEMYVYLNFCGISLIVLGILNIIGIRTTLNFNAPFSARNLIGYWQRWHISFSTVLKSLFFTQSRKMFGMAVAVVVVFTASAMWHGITLNFLVWGLFHATGWLITYYLFQLNLGKSHHWKTIKATINIVFMFIFIVVGRLIFSEDDSQLLWEKVKSLLHFSWNENALVLNMGLDTQTFATLLGCFAIIGLEMAFPKRMFNYKALRQSLVLVALLGLTFMFGSTGLGSAYGSR